MKTLRLLTFLLIISATVFGQDGSDIRYFKISAVDHSLIGQFIHLDFFRRSFGGIFLDTVDVNVEGQLIRFAERRRDDGYNNWFFEQYLQSIDKINGQTIRISKCKLDSVTSDSLSVTMYLDFYTADDKLLSERSRQLQYSFAKKDIAEVLVKSKQR